MKKIKRFSNSPLKKKARRGFQGYPVATIAFYGPDDQRASKVAVGIVNGRAREPDEMERWYLEDGDARNDLAIEAQIVSYIRGHAAKSVVMTDQIIGCPHEEALDYSDGEVCPHCPFWANRDRWTGEMVQ